MPLFSHFLGSLILTAMWIGGNLRDGLLSLGVMAAVGSCSCSARGARPSAGWAGQAGTSAGR